MKKITSALILVSQLFFGSSLLANTDGMAVIDYQAIFFGTDAARQAFEELQESDEYKEITDDIALKDGERKDAADKLEKDGPTMSESEKADLYKKIQSLTQDLQFLAQKRGALEQELGQKLQAEQAETVQKVVNELIIAKKIKLLFRREALAAFEPVRIILDPISKLPPKLCQLVRLFSNPPLLSKFCPEEFVFTSTLFVTVSSSLPST